MGISRQKCRGLPSRPSWGSGGREVVPKESRVLNRFGESWPEMRRKPGTDTNFRRSLPEFGCLSQGLPNGTGCPFVVSPKRLSTQESRSQSAILNCGRIVAAHCGFWTRLPAGDHRYFRLRLQGRPARAAGPHGKRAHPRLDVGPIYRPYPPRPGLRAVSSYWGSTAGAA